MLSVKPHFMSKDRNLVKMKMMKKDTAENKQNNPRIAILLHN